MSPRLRTGVAFLAVLAASALNATPPAQAQDAPPAAKSKPAAKKSPRARRDAPGFYKGRRIADVMSYLGAEWLIYFDHYTKPHYYGAYKTSDWKTFEDVSPKVKFPEGQRHGTAVKLSSNDPIIQELGKNRPR